MPTRPIFITNASRLEEIFPSRGIAASTRAVEMAPNLVIAKGQVLGQITVSGKYSPYAPANTDGTNTPDVIAVYDCVTDANGQVFLGINVPTSGIASYPEPTLEAYYAGDFLATDLIGFDAGAMTAFRARPMANGTLIHIP